MIALTVVERPTPLRPEQADHLAGADMHVDALQDVALAVIGVQIARLPASGRLLAEIGFPDLGIAADLLRRARRR